MKPSQKGRSLPSIQVLITNMLNQYSRVGKSMGFGVTLGLGLTLVLFIRPYIWLEKKNGCNSSFLPISIPSAMWLWDISKREVCFQFLESGLSLQLGWPTECGGSDIANSNLGLKGSSSRLSFSFFFFSFFFSFSFLQLLFLFSPSLSCRSRHCHEGGPGLSC